MPRLPVYAALLVLLISCSSEREPHVLPVGGAPPQAGWVPLTVAEQRELLKALDSPTPLTDENAQLVAARLKTALPDQVPEVLKLVQSADSSGPGRHVWANGVAALLRFDTPEAQDALTTLAHSLPEHRMRAFIEILGLKGGAGHLVLLEPFTATSDLTLRALASRAVNLIHEREGGA